MKGCFNTLEDAMKYIKYLAWEDPNVSVKVYCEAGCWYVEGYGKTVCSQPPIGWYCTRSGGHEGPCAAYQNGEV